jgi:lauroyl/myristoyl acyltransferase
MWFGTHLTKILASNKGYLPRFFGIQAATLTAPRRLQKINNSAVMMVHFSPSSFA